MAQQCDVGQQFDESAALAEFDELDDEEFESLVRQVRLLFTSVMSHQSGRRLISPILRFLSHPKLPGQCMQAAEAELNLKSGYGSDRG